MPAVALRHLGHEGSAGSSLRERPLHALLNLWASRALPGPFPSAAPTAAVMEWEYALARADFELRNADWHLRSESVVLLD